MYMLERSFCNEVSLHLFLIDYHLSSYQFLNSDQICPLAMPKMKWTGWRNWKSPALVSLENARALKMVQWSWLPLVQHRLQHLLLSWPQPHPEEDWLWTSWPTIMWLSRGAFMDTNLDIKVCPLFNVIWLYVKSLINFWLLIVKVGSRSSIGEH